MVYGHNRECKYTYIRRAAMHLIPNATDATLKSMWINLLKLWP